MANLLLSPLFAFLIYGVLVGILALVSKAVSMRGKTSHLKTSIYASGEEHDTTSAAPGYRPFFVAALFFAVLVNVALKVLLLMDDFHCPAAQNIARADHERVADGHRQSQRGPDQEDDLAAEGSDLVALAGRLQLDRFDRTRANIQPDQGLRSAKHRYVSYLANGRK